MSRTKIQSVAPGTPAHQAGVRPGETLLAINGHPIVDVLDYKYYAYDPELVLQLRSEAGERTVELSKDVGEDLGLTFATYLMDRARSCANKCVFCFVDQMPQGMRDTLYFKDDDARLSFLMGNYITLTNLSRRELQRICDLHISPINISVHATDPAAGQPAPGRGVPGDHGAVCPGGDRDELPDRGLSRPQRWRRAPAEYGGPGGPLPPGEKRLRRPRGPDPVPEGALSPAALHRRRGPGGGGPGGGLRGPVPGGEGEPDFLVLRRVLPPGGAPSARGCIL